MKNWYVDCLVDMLKEEETDHEEITAPFLVLASVSKGDFKEKCIDKYTYSVIGGAQRFSAILRVNESGVRNIVNRRCVVYSSDLGKKATLVLARQHNEFNQIQRCTTFPELAASCRRLMFAHFALEGKEDDGMYMPTIPRYNSSK